MLSHSIPGLKPPHPHLSLSLLPSSQFLSAALQSPTDKKPSKWTSEEDELLRTYVSSYNGKQWKKISENIPGKTPIQCLHRWSKILKPGLVKGPWTQEEDQKLIEWVKKSGSKKWSQAANAVPGRSGKQCRERWLNNLDPEIKKGDWSLKEDETIFEMYRKYGSSWSKMARKLKGRTENAIKNRFYSALRRVAVSRPGGEEKKDDLMLDEEEDQERMEEEVGLKEKGESEKKEMKEEDENDKRIEEKKEGLDKENNNLNRPALERKQQVTKKRKFDRESVDMSEPIHLNKKPVLGESGNIPGSLRSIDLLNDILLLRINANQRNSPKVANELGSLQTVLRVFINSIKDTIRMASTLSSRYMNEITSVAVQGSSLVNNQEAGTKIRRLLAQLNGLENWQKNAQDEVKKLETTFFEGDDINHNSKD